MSAVLHHEDLLLDDAEVVALLEFNHFDGCQFSAAVTLGLRERLVLGN